MMMTKIHERIRIRVELAYDGTDFSGWALQPERRTVQGTLEDALSILLGTERIALTVAGRTDAGVHALRQTCHFDVPAELLPKLEGRANKSFAENVARRLNGVLLKLKANDVEVISASRVPNTFDARFSALSRHYEYRLRDATSQVDPLKRRYTARVKDVLNIDILNDAAGYLIGLHDFGAFCKPREGATTIRELEYFYWKEIDRGEFVGALGADAFCHSMVRNLVGAVVAVTAGRLRMATFQEIFEKAERTSLFRVMPPEGLTLKGVDYPDQADFELRAVQTRAPRDPNLFDN